MKPLSYLQMYKTSYGVSMCEVALRPNGLNKVVLGLNFMQNVVQLFDLDKKKICLL